MRSCCVLSDPNRDNLPCFIPIKGKIKEVHVWREERAKCKKKGKSSCNLQWITVSPHQSSTSVWTEEWKNPWRPKPAMKKKRLGRKHGEHPIFSCYLNSVKNNKNIFKMFSKIRVFENTENNLILLGQTSFQCFFVPENRKQFLKTSTKSLKAKSFLRWETNLLISCGLFPMRITSSK